MAPTAWLRPQAVAGLELAGGAGQLYVALLSQDVAELGAFLILSVAWDVLQLLASWMLERDVSLGTWLNILLWSLVMRLLGNRLYLRRARPEVANVRQAFPEDPARQAAQLGSVGGTSGWWLLAGVGLSPAAGAPGQAHVDTGSLVVLASPA